MKRGVHNPEERSRARPKQPMEWTSPCHALRRHSTTCEIAGGVL